MKQWRRRLLIEATATTSTVAKRAPCSSETSNNALYCRTVWRSWRCLMGGARWWPFHLVRKRFGVFFFTIVTFAFFTLILLNVNISVQRHNEDMEQKLAEVHMRVQFMEALYRARQEDMLVLEGHGNSTGHAQAHLARITTRPTLPSEIVIQLKNMTGTRTANGFNTSNLTPLKMPPMAYQLMPHLLNDPDSVRPMFHVRGNRAFVDVVIGLPSVRRDKESYLIITLTQLVEGLSEEDEPSTLIVVFLGETDPEYILHTSKQIETLFPKQIDSGLIEILAPSPSFYPDLQSMKPTLGDPAKRFKWRTKQNLDNIFLMTYCQPRATFYLMIEDDIIAKKNYVKEIKKFAAAMTVVTPHWLVLEFCRVGGIGKLFKSSDLFSFITYVQLFYTNLPIDWLIESFLADKVCTIEKSSKQCIQSKLEIRPRYERSLFQHIGLYSSLSGKIQKIKDGHFGTVPQFIPHSNPPLANLRTTMLHYSVHSLRKAYDGETFFWALGPKKDDVLEFTFQTPMNIGRYKFKSGSVEHVSDKFYSTTVEALPSSAHGNESCYVTVGHCDEYGSCEGSVDELLGKIDALKLHIHEDSNFWVLVTEILISEKKQS